MVVPLKVCIYYLKTLRKLYGFSNALLAYEFLLLTIFAAISPPGRSVITATSGLAKREGGSSV